VDEHRLAFDGLDEVGIDGIEQPRGHRAVHLQVARRHFFAASTVGHDHPADSLPQVLQVPSNGQNGHHFAGDGHPEARVHLEPVHLLAKADADVAKGLGAEVHHPADLDAIRIDVQAFELALGQAGVVVVPLVLEPSGQGDHRQVVGVGHAIEIARQADGDRRQGHALSQAPTRGGALDIERRGAARLANGSADPFAEPAEALDQADRRGRLALTQRRRGDRGHIDVLGDRTIGQAGEDLLVVHLRQLVSVRDQLVVPQPHLAGQTLNGFHAFLGRLGDLPILHYTGIKIHQP